MNVKLIEVLVFSLVVESAAISAARAEWAMAAVLGAAAIVYFTVRRGWQFHEDVMQLIGPTSKSLKLWGWVIVGALALMFTQIVGLILMDRLLATTPAAFSLTSPTTRELVANPYFAIVACLVCPVIEEITYRGYMFRAFAGSYGALKGALLTSLAYMILHGVDTVHPVLLSLVLSALYLRTNSLLPGIILHSVWNFMSRESVILSEWLQQLPRADNFLLTGLLLVIGFTATVAVLKSLQLPSANKVEEHQAAK